MLQSKVWAGSGAGFTIRLTLAVADVDGDGDIDMLSGFKEGGLVSLRDPRYSVPANLRAFGDVNSILLHWDPDRQSRIVGYHVYRSAPGPDSFARLTSQPILLPRFEDLQPVPSATNFYQVTAVSAVNYRGNSVPICVEGPASETVHASVRGRHRSSGSSECSADHFGCLGRRIRRHSVFKRVAEALRRGKH